jgi:2'-5' RNA ligase
VKKDRPLLVHHVLELRFDTRTEELLCAAQRAYFEHSIIPHAPDGVPHISLASFAIGGKSTWGDLPFLVAGNEPFNIDFSYIGVFPSETSVVFLGITPSKGLFEFHKLLYERAALQEPGLDDMFFPDKIVFHTTLGAPVARGLLGRAIELAASLNLPKSGSANRIALVEYSPAKTLEEVEFTGQ